MLTIMKRFLFPPIGGGTDTAAGLIFSNIAKIWSLGVFSKSLATLINGNFILRHELVSELTIAIVWKGLFLFPGRYESYRICMSESESNATNIMLDLHP